jgi:hypothetical protein
MHFSVSWQSNAMYEMQNLVHSSFKYIRKLLRDLLSWGKPLQPQNILCGREGISEDQKNVFLLNDNGMFLWAKRQWIFKHEIEESGG